LRKIIGNKKGIDTILAALLMVVIVVVASVMVYAWSTGLLGTLLVQPNTGKEALNLENNAFASSNQNLTLDIRNTGSVAVSLTSYYIKNATGGQWSQLSWATQPHPPAAIQPNGLGVVNLAIGFGTQGNSGPCNAGTSTTTPCQESGSGFNTFTSGYAYTITVVTSRNNQFSWTVTR